MYGVREEFIIKKKNLEVNALPEFVQIFNQSKSISSKCN